VLAGGLYVYAVLRKLHIQRKGLATGRMVDMVRRHVLGQSEGLEGVEGGEVDGVGEEV
jgi:hypothetical protein